MDISYKERMRFAVMLAQARMRSGYSRSRLSIRAGISERTLQSWEAGKTRPDFPELIALYRAMGLNPMRDILNYVFEDEIASLTPDSDIYSIRKALHLLIDDVFSSHQIEELAFFLLGDHGSSVAGQLEMITAHNHTSPKAKVNVAQTVMNNYIMEQSVGELACPKNIMPDLDLLNECIQSAMDAVARHDTGYQARTRKGAAQNGAEEEQGQTPDD